ncbi:MAG TPA: hypothetical protein VFG42_23495 [Baekduia sp.]|uniref:hypothetical protein n=1 Tax=Baekduia sp. TaxID=2600305 RepID=UPI002D7885A4|nr:hypothetical protein [Baekduia sp.]HET6509778.1 hypothetical protein [Baekduia sp.]
MRRLATGLPVSLALLVPAAAHGAAVQTDRTCYLQTAKTNVTVSGNGFTPGAAYDIALDGQTLLGGTHAIDAGGAFRGAFEPPALATDELERQFTVTATSEATSVSTKFTITQLKADFSPATGDPQKLKVRFSVAGFGLNATNPDVYVHYVDPKGKLKETVRLGRATGQCGRIVKTAKRRLFPFDAPRLGKWKLQFDTTKAFHKGVKGSQFLFYSVGVCLQPPGAPKPSKTSPCPQQVKR